MHKEESFESADHEIKNRLLNENSLQENQHSLSSHNQHSKRSHAKRSHAVSVIEKLDFEQTLKTVGSENWYQQRAFIIFGLQWFIAAVVLLSPSFLFPGATFDCSNFDIGVNPKDSTYNDKCQEFICKRDDKDKYIDYETNSDHFSASQYLNLACQTTLNSVLQASPYAGSFTGFILFPMIADNYGRIAGWGSAWICGTLGCILMASSFNYTMMLIGYFLSGFGTNPAITLHYSFINEHSTGKLREYTGIGVQVCFGIGELFLVLQAYLIDDWRTFCIIALAVPATIMNIGLLFVYESPKYAYEKDTQKAIELLNKIAKVNKTEPIKFNALQSMVKDKEEKTYSIIDLFRYKSLRFQTYCASFIFFAIQAIYYGISFSMDQVGYDVYINTIIISVAELIAYATTDLFIPKLKRRITIMAGLGIGCVLSLCYIPFGASQNKDDLTETSKILQVILAAGFRFNISFVWTVTYVYFSELFPTTVRSLALGFTSLMGTFGSMGAPFLIQLCKNKINPMIALGAISFIAIFHALPLKETKGQELIQQIKELEHGGQDELLIEHQIMEEDEDEEDNNYNQ